ncbi:resuscitation-promoting factor [Actinacidiphila cocklensis]|uniref:Resuscitation-promoting factor RpfB n=1 Tax=Actinacidiphila cocklensis TaxID=887465 RepID=A0A9W4GWV7_9ACTN|nr:resuscitation-promoting factor [Actinacidiphila cocklensis]WSX79106.1 ubiquitin-like domain-containing protein [Streptomyces sp. NBC_00899]CAG6399358.1 putative Resuscitation-promoting factor RpfB [Actinacidiphila cocklensis]
MGNQLAGHARRLVPQTLVVAVLAGGAGAYVVADKTVRLTVDGRVRTVHTLAADVDGVLRQQHIAVGGHDIVAPAPGHPLHDGDTVAVRYGRPLTLTLDGRQQRVWTTGTTVAAALRQLGVRADGAFLDASRGAAIGRHGLVLSVRTQRRVTVVADGRAHIVRTHAMTVRGAVADAGLLLGPQDTVSPGAGAFPQDGLAVTVARVRTAQATRREPVPYRVVRHRDPSLPRGTTVVDVAGRAGLRELRYDVRTVDGVASATRVVRSRVTRAPVAEVRRVGTGRPARSPRPRVTSGTSRASAASPGLDWHALALCESGGRPHVVDPSGRYGGLYQFDVRTWRGLGGRGLPQNAGPAEQTVRAQRLYATRGTAPWPVCGRHLLR